MELGSDVVYRCLIGQRQVPWSDIAQMYVCDDLDKYPAIIRALFRIDGQLTLVRTNGARLTTTFASNQRDDICKFVEAFTNLHLPKRMRLAWWTSFGFIVAGTVAMAMGIYIDYLFCTGTWTKDFVETATTTNSKLLMTLLPYVVPAIGVAAFTYGFYHLWAGGLASGRED